MVTSSRKPSGTIHSVLRRASECIFLVSAIAAVSLAAAEPPRDLAKRVAERATETRIARLQYLYQQTVTVREYTRAGLPGGEYREVREVVFSPESGRSEELAKRPLDTLKNLKLTEEDFRDVREVQPFLFDKDQLWAYETQYKGEEIIGDVPCWILRVRPRQILAGQRLFDGLIWVKQGDFSIVRTQGKAVPEMRSTKSENLFPTFTTIWEPIDGQYWFPVRTVADDVLDFRQGPLRMTLEIRYLKYRRFSAESTVRYGESR